MYNLGGQTWDSSELSFSFVPDGSTTYGVPSELHQSLDSQLPRDQWKRIFAESLQAWANETNLNFHEVPDEGTRGGMQGDIRVAGMHLDKGLAVAGGPALSRLGGDIKVNTRPEVLKHFDEALLATTFVHEIGHSLGLGHSNAAGSIMQAYVGFQNDLGADDIAGIRSHYGIRQADSFDTSSPNDSLASASPINIQTGQTRWRADLTSHADVDFYQFRAPEGAASLTVSVDARELSLLAPKVNVYDQFQNLVATASGGYGTVATVEIPAHPGMQYTIMADGATSDVFGMGAYHLAVALESTAPASPLISTFNPQPGTVGTTGGNDAQTSDNIGNSVIDQSLMEDPPILVYVPAQSPEQLPQNHSHQDDHSHTDVVTDSESQSIDEATAKSRAPLSQATVVIPEQTLVLRARRVINHTPDVSKPASTQLQVAKTTEVQSALVQFNANNSTADELALPDMHLSTQAEPEAEPPPNEQAITARGNLANADQPTRAPTNSVSAIERDKGRVRIRVTRAKEAQPTLPPPNSVPSLEAEVPSQPAIVSRTAAPATDSAPPRSESRTAPGPATIAGPVAVVNTIDDIAIEEYANASTPVPTAAIFRLLASHSQQVGTGSQADLDEDPIPAKTETPIDEVLLNSTSRSNQEIRVLSSTDPGFTSPEIVSSIPEPALQTNDEIDQPELHVRRRIIAGNSPILPMDTLVDHSAENRAETDLNSASSRNEAATDQALEQMSAAPLERLERLRALLRG